MPSGCRELWYLLGPTCPMAPGLWCPSGTRGALVPCGTKSHPGCPVAQTRALEGPSQSHGAPWHRGGAIPIPWCRSVEKLYLPPRAGAGLAAPPGTLLSTAHCTNFSSTLRCLQQQCHNVVQHYCTNFTCAPSCLQQQSHNKILVQTLLALHCVFNNNVSSTKLYKFYSVFGTAVCIFNIITTNITNEQLGTSTKLFSSEECNEPQSGPGWWLEFQHHCCSALEVGASGSGD